MNIRLSLLVLAGLASSPGWLEAADGSKLTVEELRLNGAPAFVVLGVTPSAVEQPTSPRALASSVFSSFADNNDSGSTLPRNIALEFSPYWWFSGNQLTWDEYQLNDSIGKNLARTLTFSLASTEVELGEATNSFKATGLAFGFRANLLKGRPSKAAMAARKGLEQFLVGAARELPDDPSAASSTSFDETKYKELLQGYRQALLGRVGFQLEIAGGIAGTFTNNFNGGRLYSGGVWVTPAYRSEGGPFADLTFVGVGRYLYHRQPSDDISMTDIGARAIWTMAEKPYVVSAEYVQRFSNQPSGDSVRYGANVEYHLQNGLVVLVSLGKDFESAATGKATTFALLGFNVSLGQVAKTIK